ncbi:hypothetical protein C8263_18585 [Deinococcus arcticus]|uniref:Uncharacterized protein n=1 Tax=Deinococcus arcticus TaxID=2136176 RepID=A0A2T3W3A9_9DEIO|nr:hypothetical protein C8263_18585 [Deinococcus arcticus]
MVVFIEVQAGAQPPWACWVRRFIAALAGRKGSTFNWSKQGELALIQVYVCTLKKNIFLQQESLSFQIVNLPSVETGTVLFKIFIYFGNHVALDFPPAKASFAHHSDHVKKTRCTFRFELAGKSNIFMHQIFNCFHEFFIFLTIWIPLLHFHVEPVLKQRKICFENGIELPLPPNVIASNCILDFQHEVIQVNNTKIFIFFHRANP